MYSFFSNIIITITMIITMTMAMTMSFTIIITMTMIITMTRLSYNECSRMKGNIYKLII